MLLQMEEIVIQKVVLNLYQPWKEIYLGLKLLLSVVDIMQWIEIKDGIE